MCKLGISELCDSDKRTEYKLPLKISCAQCHSPICDEGRNMMLMFPGLIEFDRNLLPGPFRAYAVPFFGILFFSPLLSSLLRTHHMFYGSRVDDVDDDLPKFLGKKNECPFEGEPKGDASMEKLQRWREHAGSGKRVEKDSLGQ